MGTLHTRVVYTKRERIHRPLLKQGIVELNMKMMI
jgi:hypothetical protein